MSVENSQSVAAAVRASGAPFRIFIGWDSREPEAYEVARFSLQRHASIPLQITPIRLDDLRSRGLYWRGEDSLASTEFTYSRFLTPFLADYQGWALFCDCDFLWLGDVAELLQLADRAQALHCVQHDYRPSETTKMDGRVQTTYPRKNWSSLMLFNCQHPAVRTLTPDVVNRETGAYLHRLQWVRDEDVGGLPEEWNWLEGWSQRPASGAPKAVHFTRGGPWFPQWQQVDYGHLWLAEHAMAKDPRANEQIIRRNRNAYSLAVCYPVWNRGELFRASFASLVRQLDGITAAIWVFDNGSEAPTRQLVEDLSCADHRLFKVFLPQNMGIPFVVNIFSRLLTQDCDYAGYRAPTHVMLADADAYFKKPVRDMIEILERHDLAIISGHDAVEHETLGQFAHSVNGEPIVVKEKSIERGLCLIMRKEVLAGCVPFPHHVNQGVDWQLMQRHPNSIAEQKRQLGAVDYVAHIGLYDSTWHEVGVPAERAEMAEVDQILEQEGLLSSDRRERMARYRQSIAEQPAGEQ